MAVEFRDGHGLKDVELPRRAIFEKPDGLLAIQPMKKFPRCIAQIKERLAVGSDQEALVVRHLQARQRGGGVGEGDGDENSKENLQWLHVTRISGEKGKARTSRTISWRILTPRFGSELGVSLKAAINRRGGF